MSNRWTDRDDNYLRTWGYVGDFCMAMDLSRSRPAVRARAKKLGITLGEGGCDHDHVDALSASVCTCGAPLWPVHKLSAEIDAKGAEQ